MSVFDLVQPRIPECGKIKIGAKDAKVREGKGGKWRAPIKLDHFSVVTCWRPDPLADLVPDEALMESLKPSYADKDGKLRRLPIAVMSHDIEEILSCALCWYGGRRMGARSDGQTVTWWNDRKTGRALDQPIEEPWNPDYLKLKAPGGQPLFNLHTTMSMMIVSPLARFGGVYKFRTTSQITAAQLAGSLFNIKQLSGGILRGLRLELALRPANVAPDGKPTNVYVVHVEAVGSDLMDVRRQALEISQFEASNQKQIAAAQAEYRKLLAAPGEQESPAEQADIGAEFHPESYEYDAVDEPGPDEVATADQLLHDQVESEAPEEEVVQPDGEPEPMGDSQW